MKKYRVIVTQKATNDIAEISSYISNELLDRVAAKNLVQKLREGITSLSLMPKRNVLIQDEELASQGIRRLLVDNYIVFYVISEKDSLVSIIRVLYNKREWKNLI